MARLLAGQESEQIASGVAGGLRSGLAVEPLAMNLRLHGQIDDVGAGHLDTHLPSCCTQAAAHTTIERTVSPSRGLYRPDT